MALKTLLNDIVENFVNRCQQTPISPSKRTLIRKLKFAKQNVAEHALI